MPDLKTYDTFISHAWRYHDDYNRMVQLLDNAPYFTWRNYSVPRHDPADANNATRLREALRRQIRPVNIVVVLAGVYATHSDWIQFEIDYAAALGKTIVGIRPWASQRIPVAVQSAAAEMVGWNTSSIVDAIRRNA